MKIAIISIGSFDIQYSDYHIMRDIIIGLLERGHEVNLIQKQYFDIPNYPKEFEKYLGKQLIVQNIPFEKRAKQNLKARYLADLSYYSKACRLMKKNKPDKVFLQSNNTAFYTVFYAKHILKCPLIYNEQDIFPENAYFAGILNEKSYIYKVAHMLQKYAYRNATELTTISSDMKETIITRYDIPEDKIQVIYNWGHEEVHAHSVEENSFLKLYPKENREFRVIYAGNLGKMQNVELILETADLMKKETDIRFFIVGGGANEEELKAFAKEKELLNVTFVGMQPPEEVADLYSAADVNVIPLQKGIIFAALPSKTADCLIAGKPIITCVDSASRFSTLVENYCIENAGTNQPSQLKEKILRVKNKQITCNNMGLWADYFMKEKNVEAHCNSVEQMR